MNRMNERISDVTMWCSKKTQKKKNVEKKETQAGVSWGLHGLRSQCCRCCGLGYCSGASLIPGPGNSACMPCAQKKEEKKRQWHKDHALTDSQSHFQKKSTLPRLGHTTKRPEDVA